MGTLPRPLHGSDVDEEHLVPTVVNDATQTRPQFDQLALIERAPEDGELKMLAIAELVHLAQALGVARCRR